MKIKPKNSSFQLWLEQNKAESKRDMQHKPFPLHPVHSQFQPIPNHTHTCWNLSSLMMLDEVEEHILRPFAPCTPWSSFGVYLQCKSPVLCENLFLGSLGSSSRFITHKWIKTLICDPKIFRYKALWQLQVGHFHILHAAVRGTFKAVTVKKNGCLLS